eukprot:gnl/TRDRNA2_/TRDRNA2_172527_c0_seq1.p1 gnl/TRDRNA2_/TRDRNA2_172527_c0~~gnl/TRDRNA2_/TRDRNA2_172527_c0_seq1.p1  ORF type:complete len:352 (+),score=47.91 gnl/TRDRNA2_/TRDRNA2_172527_c0_seq1:74-1129(+)
MDYRDMQLALLGACADGDIKQICRLIEDSPVDPNASVLLSETEALTVTHIQDITVAHLQGGFTPILVATMNGHRAVIRVLVGLRADVNGENAVGLTALHSAASDGQSDILRQLLALRGDPTHRTRRRNASLLYSACIGGSFDTVCDLVSFPEVDIRQGCVVDAADGQPVQPLYVAAQRGDFGMAALLVLLGADLQPVGEFVPWEIAEKTLERHQNRALVAYLQGRIQPFSVLHRAKTCTDVEVFQALRDGGNLASQPIPGGPTPLLVAQIAAMRGDLTDAQQMVLDAACSWSPDRHSLFPDQARKVAVVAMQVFTSLQAHASIYLPRQVVVDRILPFAISRELPEVEYVSL